MITPNYQHIKGEQMPVVQDESGNINLKVVAGILGGNKGLISTQTDVNVFMIETMGSGSMDVDILNTHESCVYLLDGEVKINDEDILSKGGNQMIVFKTDGETIKFESTKESKLLILSGAPINEAVTQYGPYVMNTQTEILEAMRDFQQGKMGYLY